MYPDLSMHHDWPVKKDLYFVCCDRLRLAARISYGVYNGSEQKEQKANVKENGGGLQREVERSL